MEPEATVAFNVTVASLFLGEMYEAPNFPEEAIDPPIFINVGKARPARI